MEPPKVPGAYTKIAAKPGLDAVPLQLDCGQVKHPKDFVNLNPNL